MRNPNELTVFSQADAVALLVYRLTALFPKEERYGLTQQIRRAAVSVGSNIAEGCSREGAAGFRRFIEIALGSAMELRYQVGFAYRVSKLEDGVRFNVSQSAWETLREDVEQLVRALIAFSKTLRA